MEDLGKTYFSTLVGTIIQFSIMLYVYSLFVPIQYNILFMLMVALIFGLIFAPFQLLLNSKKGED